MTWSRSPGTSRPSRARDGVADLLRATLDPTDPSGFHTTEEPTEADGVAEAWIGFETAVGRGRGHLRLTDEGACTLLTTLVRAQGPRGAAWASSARRGVEHGARKDRRDLEGGAATPT